jgi:N-acetylmuramic acid 6-phosphate etherase
MSTEHVSPRFADLDGWPTADLVEVMWEAQMAAVAAVRPALPALGAAIEAAVPRLRAGGRVAYARAGTSGRLGVQDGSELPPTFAWPPERVVFLMAGGLGALTRSAEGAEDDAGAATAAIDAAKIAASDVVIGLAASGGTPFTVAAIERARGLGALTLGLACNPGARLLTAAEHPILTDTGAEVIAGSTRMKAGTAHKVVLNLLSSGIMVRLGRVHGGIMVDMKPSNAKLQIRAIGIVAHIAKCTPEQAQTAFTAAGGDIKLAVLLALGVERATAERRLTAANGHLRRAIDAGQA